MKNKLTPVILSCFLAILFSAQAGANSPIQEDFAYAFGSAEGLDSGRISPLSSQEMDEIEGLFLGWLIRVGPSVIREAIDLLKAIGLQFKQAYKDGIEHNAWLRIAKSKSQSGGFETQAIKWGSNKYHRDRKVQHLTLNWLNRSLRNTKIPLNTWRTNDPGHLHIKKLPPKTPPQSGPSSLDNSDDMPTPSPAPHRGEGGVIASIDWERITAEDLLTGKFDEALLTEAAKGPKGSKWGMEALTERQALLGLTLLAFVTDPETNADIDIPLHEIWHHLKMAIHLEKNPVKNNRIARLAQLGLTQLDYIIGQHSQDYHPENAATRPGDTHTLSDARTEASYLPIHAHWWMHDFAYWR